MIPSSWDDGKPRFKAPKGTSIRARRDAKRAEDTHEQREKAKVRLRDRSCRWPGCDCTRYRLRLEVAHVLDKSLGGSNDADNLILLCFEKHQGRPSLHSGDLRITPLSERGANGPCLFEQQINGEWKAIAAERTVGLSVERNP